MRQLPASGGLFTMCLLDPILTTCSIRPGGKCWIAELDIHRMRQALGPDAALKLVVVQTAKLALSFPLWASFVQSQCQFRTWTERIQRMAAQLEAEAKREKI